MSESKKAPTKKDRKRAAHALIARMIWSDWMDGHFSGDVEKEIAMNLIRSQLTKAGLTWEDL